MSIKRKAYLMAIFLLVFQSQASGLTTKASWYSEASCKKEGTSGTHTASGERFDEDAMTGAMWDIPFGTIVKVTNTSTSKYVYITINDRGPSRKLVKKGRIIDLSKGAFKKIADLKQGIISVKVEIE